MECEQALIVRAAPRRQQYDMVQKGQHKELELEDERNAPGGSSSGSKAPPAAPATADAMVL